MMNQLQRQPGIPLLRTYSALRSVWLKGVCILFGLLTLCLIHFYSLAQEQTDSGTENNEFDTTEEDDDTTGYYFNWKENPGDAFLIPKSNFHTSTDSIINAFKKEDDFWYVHSIEEFQKNNARIRYDQQYRDSLVNAGVLPAEDEVMIQEHPGTNWYQQDWFVFVVWLLVILVFASAVVYFLVANKISFFHRDASVLREKSIADKDLLHQIDFKHLLHKYEAEQNYRLAVRTLYLQLLKLLSDKQLIAYQPSLTNTHYRQQVAGLPWQAEFSIVTRHYEYVWYGEFAVDLQRYSKIRTDFSNLENKL